MDLLATYVRGLIVGFAIAAAIGPIGLLCIRRTLVEGVRVGAASGLGAATADAVYASIAAFGLTAASDLLVGQRRPLGIVGGCFPVALAAHALISRSEAATDRPPRSLLSAYATTVGLTIANPATILSFAAAFVGLGLAGHERRWLRHSFSASSAVLPPGGWFSQQACRRSAIDWGPEPCAAWLQGRTR